MINRKKIIPAVIFLALILMVIWILGSNYYGSKNHQQTAYTNCIARPTGSKWEGADAKGKWCKPSWFSLKKYAPTEETPQKPDTAPLVINTPTANTKITSPINITGQAPGFWFFEAQFPIEVKNLNGDILGSGIATAEGEWMTESMVAFSATISFDKQDNSEGLLVFHKDNPSGLPEHNQSVFLPIKFK